ncbi:MAG: CRISPR-associated helicase Cas3' [Magnetococcales bacterium]|nr:CRISPR-associated helicase Cas3' [Magnetococcales bacterium]
MGQNKYLYVEKQTIAHHRKSDRQNQLLENHLQGVANQAKVFADKLQLGRLGELLGLLHDMGKYSASFQDYLRLAIRTTTTFQEGNSHDPDCDATDDQPRRVDHSSAGAQWVWHRLRLLQEKDPIASMVGQIVALCVASHHSGLMDCLHPSANKPVEDHFSRRMNKEEQQTHLDEVRTTMDPQIKDQLDAIMNDGSWVAILQKILQDIAKGDRGKKRVIYQKIGLLVRFLFSCLIDADRIDSADFEHPDWSALRANGRYADWQTLCDRLEQHLAELPCSHPVDEARHRIANHCREAAERDKGCYTLTVPTGGGKTLSSLRFALHHARRLGMERIFYIIPYTSIIDQNARVVRSILEKEGEEGSIVLEHHANLTGETETWPQKVMARESWDAPIIFTTMVQFLETLFGGGTRGVRRMHRLAKAVIIFDEPQTLPVNCVHLFNNAVNFLQERCGCSLLFCTATQPLLHSVDAAKGALKLSDNAELMPEVTTLFQNLQRVRIQYRHQPEGWSVERVAELALAEVDRTRSCLVVVNTKAWARALYRACRERGKVPLVHLSTSMCPAHRRAVLREIMARLPDQPILCISTQLIEAGVDVDFGTVIRALAGVDSIAQAAGRCNRHGMREKAVVHVVNLAGEKLKNLQEIEIGQDKARVVLEKLPDDPIGPEAISLYYKNFFFARADRMDYPITNNQGIGVQDTLLNLLSTNDKTTQSYERDHQGQPKIHFRQSFMTAGKLFKVIDAPSQGILVPYGTEGNEVIAALCSSDTPEKQYALLRRAQHYAVNLFPDDLGRFRNDGIVQEIQPGTGIFYLVDHRYYSPEFGLSDNPEGKMEVLCDT